MLLQGAVEYALEHTIIALAGFERQVIAEQHKALWQFDQLLDHPRQVRQVIALDFDQAQPGLGVLGQQGAHHGRFTGAARAPEQRMVGRQAVEKLLGVTGQLFALFIHADQVGQAHIQADFQWQ